MSALTAAAPTFPRAPVTRIRIGRSASRAERIDESQHERDAGQQRDVERRGLARGLGNRGTRTLEAGLGSVGPDRGGDELARAQRERDAAERPRRRNHAEEQPAAERDPHGEGGGNLHDARWWPSGERQASDLGAQTRAGHADLQDVRLASTLAAAVITLAAPASAQAASLGGWNKSEQREVAQAGLLPKLEDGRFHGERSLSGAQLSAALGEQTASAAKTVSVTSFDARLVNHLGLADVAAHVRDVARGAGLHPPKTFGTEVVARFLGLRTNHPAEDETLELFPWEPITRAEAAHSLAVILDQGDWAVAGAREQLSAFELPQYD